MEAIGGINLEVEEGEFLAIVGTSEYGKSTFLETLAGLRKLYDLWAKTYSKSFDYHNLTPKRESDINLSLESGLYILEINTIWKEKGSVSYGFLVNVQ